MIESYGKVYHTNDRNAAGAFDGPLVIVQEKIDGSQFSFGVVDGKLYCRSKNKILDLDSPEDLFGPAVDYAKNLHQRGQLPEGRVYRAEAMKGPKHNLLTYARAPEGGMVLFDIDGLKPAAMHAEAATLGLESAMWFHLGGPTGSQDVEPFLSVVSMLGGVNVEGVVIKSYDGHGRLLARGKVVSDAFREVRKSKGGRTRGGGGSSAPLADIIADYATPARYAKARIHLEEQGELTGDRSDIGRIVREVQADVAEECATAIAQRLWEANKKPILSGISRGVAEWFGGAR